MSTSETTPTGESGDAEVHARGKEIMVMWIDNCLDGIHRHQKSIHRHGKTIQESIAAHEERCRTNIDELQRIDPILAQHYRDRLKELLGR